MKSISCLVTILLATTLFGCKPAEPPKSDARVESASEAARADDRAIATRLASQKAAVDEAYQKARASELKLRNVEALRVVSTRWSAALAEASSAPRVVVATLLKKLQTIKGELDTVEVDDCTGAARITLRSAMTASIDAVSAMEKETGVRADTTTQKLQQGADLLSAALQEMDACSSK